MCPWVASHAPSCGRRLWGLPSRMEYLSPQGVLLLRVYSTTALLLWLELRGPAAWQATPSWAVCWHACHQLLPSLRATFAMVPDAAWPGSDQQPWISAPATGPVGRLGRPSASDPGGVGLGVLSLCCPRCMCVCGVLAHVAPVHRCARCVRCACAVGGCVPLPPPLIFFSVFFLLSSCFVLSCLFFFLSFFLKNGKGGARTLQAQAWATGAEVVLCPLVCVVGALVAAAPQGCGSRVLMYTGTGQGGFGQFPLCFWCWLVRRLCGLRVWVVATLLPRRVRLGVKG